MISKKVVTKDKSITFYNEKFKETYHSITGAEEEAVKKFADFIPLNKQIKILDVCFGIGYNTAAALDKNQNCKVIALEDDINIISKIKTLNPNFNSYDEIKKAADNKSNKVKIIIDDARKSIKQLDEKFDVVFFDPFSPKKCPELWTKEFLKNIKSKMKENAVFCTYSCASKFRRIMKELNFEVKDGPCVGRRAPSTVAYNY